MRIVNIKNVVHQSVLFFTSLSNFPNTEKKLAQVGNKMSSSIGAMMQTSSKTINGADNKTTHSSTRSRVLNNNKRPVLKRERTRTIASASETTSSSNPDSNTKTSTTTKATTTKTKEYKQIEQIPGGTPEDAQNKRLGRNDGRPTYCPPSYAAMCMDAFACVRDAMGDGETLIEVEFPAVPGEDADYKAASDVYIDANVQYGLVIGQKIFEKLGKKVQILLPDGIEFRRARKQFERALEMTEGVTLNTLDGRKADSSLTGMFQKIGMGQGLRSGPEREKENDFEDADLFILVNVSCGELPDVEKFVKEQVKGRTVIMLNNQLETLRADLGLISFPPKSLHYDFLSFFKPVFYLRSRAYSRSISVSPFVVNYSGAVFREYPAPWQVMIKQSNGVLACIAEDEDRFTLGEAKEEMLLALGLNDPEGSFMKAARSGLVVNTWWEADSDEEKSDAWRT